MSMKVQGMFKIIIGLGQKPTEEMLKKIYNVNIINLPMYLLMLSVYELKIVCGDWECLLQLTHYTS